MAFYDLILYSFQCGDSFKEIMYVHGKFFIDFHKVISGSCEGTLNETISDGNHYFQSFINLALVLINTTLNSMLLFVDV